ncbi:hypothetical protein BU23DRAFT_567022 [Bimuria novae-zelandiae CBS 107.79]|uniref:Uncharacterized protein n=1 Tax=Bimuria novae-zelandiae CBS 107.79 TaxID=1447943 RepID=A0A6A5VNY8_9PLEO|nr:hypothetical protein BU23DRAFT_567022 [Bimuria novae-zelandiae CBS 107.79]
MDLSTPRIYGQSRSMPILPSYTEDEADQDYAMELSYEQVLHDIQYSPGYQLLSDSGTHMPPLHRRDAGVLSVSRSCATDKNEATAMSSPRSDCTVKPGDTLESGGITLTPMQSSGGDTEFGSAASQGPGVVGDRNPANLVQTSAPQFSAHAADFRPMVPQNSDVFSEDADTHDEEFATYRATSSVPSATAANHGTTQDPFMSPNISAFDGFNMGSPVKNKKGGGSSGMQHFGAVGTARVVAEDTPNDRGSRYHGQTSSAFSFVPVLPSPEGPGTTTYPQGPNDSGLLSPSVTAPPFTTKMQNQWRDSPAPQTASLHTPSGIPFTWTQITPDCYSPFDMSPINDPFLEHQRAPTEPQTPPTTSSSGYTPHRRRAPTPPTHPRIPSSQSRDHVQDPSVHPMTGLSMHPPLPIPPPALPFRQPQSQNPQSRHPDASARLEAQKPLRKDWIETQASYLSNMARTAALAKAAYHASQRAEDYERWSTAQAACLRAWDLQRLTLERRNLTLPSPMRALTVEPGTGTLEDAMGKKEGGVLGYKMALMERICAVAVAKVDTCKMDMDAARLGEVEKREVRKAMVRDVVRGTERRVKRGKEKWTDC